VKALGGRCFVKSARGGYDGRSQAKLGFDENLPDAKTCAQAWESLGKKPVVVERAQNLQLEFSVMVARSARGECKCYPPALNHHEQQILVWSGMPAPLPPQITRQAQELARAIAEEFSLEGLLAVEMFLTTEGKLLVNELAPRPHNSYHGSERACATSQFEQAIRAVCNLPLGDVEIIQPTAIANLLGDVWLEAPSATGPRFDEALALHGVRLHLYEKHVPRRGRKMGHLSATGSTVEAAVKCVMEAKGKL
jgi:5-(carboxyamino)imidazole ribonucleotide synthase